ncbi:MAG TPA: TonB family protein [Terracidiphilus sp.]|nr:TonB family protein [Terracidiphilus sp.]
MTDREAEAPGAGSASRSVALIGPNDASRKVVARALASSGAVTVREFVSYPNSLNDVPRLSEQRFDMLMIDVDCDESYALAIVEKVVASGKTVVMTYSQRNQPELAQRCKQAGARDFLPIPAYPEVPEPTPEPAAPSRPSPAAAQPKPAVPTQLNRRATDRPSAQAATGAAPRPAAPAVVDRPPLPPRDVLDPPKASSVQPLAAVPEVSDPLPERNILRKPASTPQPQEIDLDPPIFRYVGMASPPEEPRRGIPKWLFAIVPLGAAVGLVIAFFPQIRQAFPVGLPSPLSPSSYNVGPYVPPASSSGATSSGAPADASAPRQAESAADGGKKPVAATPASAPAMDAQLNAPARISGDLKKPAPKDEPAAGFASTGLDSDSSAAPGAAFSTQHNVRVAPSAAISAGVAAGMLIRRTEPLYPKFARDNHINGTVVLGATITKAGAIQNLHVISGPTMLREAALSAVRTWRYRPYLLNNQPVEVQTTINIVFNADK